MSDIDNDPILETPDELTSLKARADLLGIKYHPSISLEKLRDKVNSQIESSSADSEDKAAELAQEMADAAALTPVKVETEAERRGRRKREANELIRIRVTCMNPAKSEWAGEIFTAGNSLVGSFTKYIPFNSDEGWHVPRIIYNQVIERKCQIFTTIKDDRGNSTRKGKLIKEFAVEIMPNLTVDELKELAQRQAMSKAIV